jgi:hypothetical protein
MKNYNTQPIQDLLNQAKTALVVVPQLNVDSIGAALALAISLNKKNIQTKVFCPQKPDQNYQKLSGLELLTDSIESSDLVVSVTYPLDQIDKVSYNDDGGKLNLVVQTKEGAPKIESNQISFQSGGASADVCFMLGDETTLGDKAGMVNKGNWILISPTQVQKSWAKATLVDPDAPFCEVFTFLLPMLGLELDMDSGKDLLIGLRVATQSFSVNVSPETFEAGAINLKATQSPETPVQNSFDNQAPIEAIERGANTPVDAGQNKPNPNPMV